MYDSIFISRGLSLSRLKVLLEVDEAGSITSAAGGDAVRQSQYSRQLKELESFFGCELTHREGRFLRLTQRGKKLAAIARENITSLADFLADCEKQTTVLRIGAGESIIRWIITPALKNISKQLPAVSFDFRNIRSQEAINQLSQSQIDLAIIRSEIVPDYLESQSIGSMDYALYIPKGFDVPPKPSGKGRPPSLRKLIQNTPFGRMESGGSMAAVLKENEDRPPVLFMDSLPSLCNAVNAGFCCGILPTPAERELNDCEIYHPPEAKKMSRKLSLVWNRRFEIVRHNAAKAIRAFTKELTI